MNTGSQRRRRRGTCGRNINAHDGASNQVGEEANEQEEFPKLSDRAEIAPVNVDRVTERRERIEANSQGKDDTERVKTGREPERVERGLGGFKQKIGVLVIEK